MSPNPTYSESLISFHPGSCCTRGLVLASPSRGVLPKPVLADREPPWVHRVVGVLFLFLFFCCWLPSHFSFQANTGTWQRGRMNLQMISTGVRTGILSIRVSSSSRRASCVESTCVCLHVSANTHPCLHACVCWCIISCQVSISCNLFNCDIPSAKWNLDIKTLLDEQL